MCLYCTSVVPRVSYPVVNQCAEYRR